MDHPTPTCQTASRSVQPLLQDTSSLHHRHPHRQTHRQTTETSVEIRRIYAKRTMRRKKDVAFCLTTRHQKFPNFSATLQLRYTASYHIVSRSNRRRKIAIKITKDHHVTAPKARPIHECHFSSTNPLFNARRQKIIIYDCSQVTFN